MNDQQCVYDQVKSINIMMEHNTTKPATTGRKDSGGDNAFVTNIENSGTFSKENELNPLDSKDTENHLVHNFENNTGNFKNCDVSDDICGNSSECGLPNDFIRADIGGEKILVANNAIHFESLEPHMMDAQHVKKNCVRSGDEKELDGQDLDKKNLIGNHENWSRMIENQDSCSVDESVQCDSASTDTDDEFVRNEDDLTEQSRMNGEDRASCSDDDSVAGISHQSPDVGKGLLKIEVKDPLHDVKHDLQEGDSDSETDIDNSDQLEDDVKNCDKKSNESAATKIPYPPLHWLERAAKVDIKDIPPATSTSTAPSSDGKESPSANPSQMIRFLSEKISSALQGTPGDFHNQGQDVLTEKISDILLDVYGTVPEPANSSSSTSPVFKDKHNSQRELQSISLKTKQTKNKSLKTSKQIPMTNTLDNVVVGVRKSKRDPSAKTNYRCSTCDKGFSFSIQLKKHVCPLIKVEQVVQATEESDERAGKSDNEVSNHSDEETEVESEAEMVSKAKKVNNVIKTRKEKLRKIWKCDDCGQSFTTKMILNSHMRSHHIKNAGTGKTYKCHCGKGYNTKGSLMAHKHVRHSEMPYQCNICDADFMKLQHLRTHEREKHADVKPFGCDRCEKCFCTPRRLRDHQRHHSSKKQLVCEICGKAYSHSKSLREHRVTHTEGKKHSCEICGKGFVHKYTLGVHARIHSGLKPYVCQVCSKTFVTSGALNVHGRIHSGNKPYRCKTCGKEFSQGSNLVIHERTHSGERPYKCDVCEKTFARGGDLVKHKDTHMTEKPFKCEHCNKGFARKQLMIEHVRQHTGDKPYICQVCGKGFSRCHSVVEHERIHTGVKPFKCDQCGKAFTYSSHLKIHLRIHSGERPYKCQYCDRTFTNISNKIKHERTHTGLKPYSCKHCGKKFNVKGDMVRHEQTHGRMDHVDYRYEPSVPQQDHVNPILPLYGERVITESEKVPMSGYADLGEAGFNANSFMFQQL